VSFSKRNKRSVLLAAGIAGVVSLFDVAIAATVTPTQQDACPAPAKGIRHGVEYGYVGNGSFAYQGRTFLIATASAYATRNANNATSYCIRYEAKNVTPLVAGRDKARIDAFWWPLSTISAQYLESGEQRGITLTGSGSGPPQFDDVDVWAFKNAHFLAHAYKFSSAERFVAKILLASFTADGDAAGVGRPYRLELQLAQFSSRDLLKSGPVVPIGAIWDNGAAAVSATTTLNLDKLFISIEMEGSGIGSIGEIYAPFAKALATAKELNDVPKLMTEYRQSPVAFDGMAAVFANENMPVDLTSDRTQLYPVLEPIVV
jgi:hypothetical protein